MKIGTRTGAGFAVVLLAIVTGFGVRGMTAIQAGLDDIVEDVGHTEKLLVEMSASADVIAHAMRAILLPKDAAVVAAERKQLDLAYQQYGQAISALEKAAASAKTRAPARRARPLAGSLVDGNLALSARDEIDESRFTRF